MNSPRTFLSRISSLFRLRRLDADLDEELRSHIDLATAENMTLGMSPKQARTAALRSFGGITQTRETYRIHRGFPLLGQLARDLNFGMRQLYRAPGFALTAVLTLALGLGANTAVFSLINGLILRQLPVPHPDELANLYYSRTDLDDQNYVFCLPFVRSLEKRHDVFSSVAAYSFRRFQVRNTSGNEEIPGAIVSGQFFSTLQTQPLLGRYLTPQDDPGGSSPAGFGIVISESFWRSWFNGTPNIIGRQLNIANTSFTIVGVMPKQFFGDDPTERPSIFASLSAEPILDAPYNNSAGGFRNWWLNIVARRKPGISLEQANAALKTVSNPILDEAIPDAAWIKTAREHHFYFGATPGASGYTYLRTFFQKPLYVVFALCGTMLLLACLNLASLLMARAAARERELATRLAIGASRRRLIQQLLVESLLLASLGTVAGLVLSPFVSSFLASLLLGANSTSTLETRPDLNIFAFAALLTLTVSLLIGLVPALRATSSDLNEQIKSGSQSLSSRRHRRLLPRILMASQVALALLLVVGAGLLASSLARLYSTGLGFEPKGLVNLDLSMDKQSLEGDPILRWYQSLGETLAHQPGVQSVTFQSVVPLSGSSWSNSLFTPFNKNTPAIYMNAVAPNYFATMRIPILSGREFTWNDTKASGSKIILNQSAAKQLFPNRNPIGQTVYNERDPIQGKSVQYQVVAVVGDVHYSSIREAAPAGAYIPVTQFGFKKPSFTATIRLKAGSDAAAVSLAASARAIVSQMAPDIPAPTMTTMSSQLDDSISSERMMAILSVFFAACALLVTAIGLYGTLAYSTARRTSEIGIRMALGAQRLQVIALIFRENAWVASAGSLAGLGVALLASRILQSFLYGTSIHDPWILAGSVAALALVASAASILPALRAARVEPMTALRSE